MKILFVIMGICLSCTLAKVSFKGKLWLSTSDGKSKLSKQDDVKFRLSCDLACFVIDVDDTVTNATQTIHGFGATISDKAVKLFMEQLPKNRQVKILKEIFGPNEGLKLNILRIVFGPARSDDNPTYDDTCCTLNDFSVEKDVKEMTPLLKMIRTVNPKVHIIGTFYSPPTWMKTENTLDGGSLDPKRVLDFAMFVALTIQAYEEAGINIYAVSVQDSPTKLIPEHHAMLLNAETESDLVKNNLKWSLRQFNLTTKVLVGEVNWNEFQYCLDALNGSENEDVVLGSAFHCAEGEASSQEKVHEKMKDKEIWVTECSYSDLKCSLEYGDIFITAVKNVMIRGFRNWANAIVKYTLNADKIEDISHSTPKYLELETNGGSEFQISEFYSMAHFSRFVKRGAKRIQSTNHQNIFETVAFKNPDGEIILVVVNNGEVERPVRVRYGSDAFDYVMKSKSAITVTWMSKRSSRILDAYLPIEAESYTQHTGTKSDVSLDEFSRGSSVTFTENEGKHFLVFKNVNFHSSGTTHVEAHVRAKVASKLQFILDSMNGNLLADVAISNSSEFEIFNSTIIKKVGGIHNLYVICTSGQATLNWFRFVRKLDIKEEKWYKIESVNSAFSLDVRNKETNPGMPVIQWTFQKGINQEFGFKATNEVYNGFRIIDRNSKLCLKASLATKMVVLGECESDGQVVWILNPTSDSESKEKIQYNIVTKDSKYGMFASQEKGSRIKIVEFSCSLESQQFVLTVI